MEIKNNQKQLNIDDIQEKGSNAGIRERNIVDEMKMSYINYSMSVIIARALPDVRDGLKPVQRRILYAMFKSGYLPSKSYKKSARTVGDVMGKYHPHGDLAIYDAMVRMAQNFNTRYLLIDGQGNFGSIDGDSPAAMRYTEARLHRHALELVEDLDKSTVDFVSNYDGSYKEPYVLPAKLPNILLNGADGIAVGMATKIPSHNIGEIIDAVNFIIKNGNKWKSREIDNSYIKNIKTLADLEKLSKDRFPEFETDLEVEEIMTYIPGPDFPTGGIIYDRQEILTAYATGKGRILMRGVAEIKEGKNSKYQIIITEIPYQVNKARLVAKIAELVKTKKIEGISDLRDESNKEGLRIVIDIKRDGKPKTILNKLYKFTELQKAFNANMIALVDGEPKLLNLKKILELFIKHRQEIVTRRTEFNLAKSKEREHILEGLIIALDNLDEIISIIRKSKDGEAAKENLIKKFKLTEIQAQAILDMQLRRLAALERQKIEDEYKDIKKQIIDLINILETPERILQIISQELNEIRNKFADKRKTKVVKGKVDEFSEEDLIAKEDVIVTVSHDGYIKRLKTGIYTEQHRGGVGKKMMTTKENDYVEHVFKCNTHDEILFFTNKGRVFREKVYNIKESGRTAKGQAVINLIDLSHDELVTSILTRDPKGQVIDEDIIQEEQLDTENKGKNYKYLFMVTDRGTVKKTSLTEFENIRNSGIIAIKLSAGDKLKWVRPTEGNNEIMLVTKNARSIRFNEKDVRPTRRDTMGVRGIKFKNPEDEVIVAEIIRREEDLLMIVSEKGFGKATVLEQFPTQNRGGQGVYAARINDKTGNLASARVLDHPGLHLIIMSQHGQAVKIPTEDLPRRNRQTSGVRLMKLKSTDKVAAIAII